MDSCKYNHLRKNILPCDGIPSTPYSLVCKSSQIKHGRAINLNLPDS